MVVVCQFNIASAFPFSLIYRAGYNYLILNHANNSLFQANWAVHLYYHSGNSMFSDKSKASTARSAPSADGEPAFAFIGAHK